MTTRPNDETQANSDPARSAGVGPIEPSMDLRDLERESAMVRLFDGHHAQLLRLAVLLGAEQDAEDIVAEAFCELHRTWYRLRDPEAGPRYLRSVVVNLVRMRIRHIKVLRKHIDFEASDVESAESAALLREDQRKVVDALQALPARQREALVLRYWLDLKEVEIAEAMRISQGAVKSHISRGMHALSRMMGARS
ncbi:sigma-70 family RNA polymerase sigma factor [Saccharopolyspora karakumensis]|uniref:Sigma-70 family RNA polymerase sigma factor n=1 Tax=Saccharopolyspora karakumensis TaxID=2530386 RepID=A0A4R5BWG3_9PSEU|nr:sigma-70 family RNA polymerase sigma factor [Saccharopolyspora karakumensis]TDD89993.1 sigma-70 family RNA polymerase sigma factor [Saccharopolyspora karakumensis]